MDGQRRSDLALRRCTPDDYTALLTWIDSAHALHLFTGAVLSWPLTLRQFDALKDIDGRTDWTLVDAAAPGEALGHIEITRVGAMARLSRVLVAPARRRRGCGRSLVALAIGEAQRQGAEEVGLNVVRGNEPAIRTYSALGFTPLPSQPRSDVVAMVVRVPERPSARWPEP